MITIRVGEVYSTIDAPANVMSVVHKVCRARPSNFMYMPKYRAKVWDGYITLMKGAHRVPTGLLGYIEEAMYNYGVVVKYEEEGIRRVDSYGAITESVLNGVHLRDYQYDAVSSLLSAERGIAKMATNAGKTVVFSALIHVLNNADAMVIVQTRELLYQTHDRMEEYLGRTVGLIGDSHVDYSDVCVATIQTLMSLRKKLSKNSFRLLFASNKILIVDECHHISDNKTFDVLMDIPGWYRYGMSGTPLRRGTLNDYKLISCTGPVVVEVGNDFLIKEEWSAKPIIFMHDYADEYDTDDMWDASYMDAYQECIVDNDIRNSIVVDSAVEELPRGPVLVIVSRIEHGNTLLESLKSRCNSIFVHGSTDIGIRIAALKRIAKGEHIVVIATQIFDEGVDVPALDTIILACGGASHKQLLQRIGRGLRKKVRNILHVHDFLDSDNKHLLNHTERRYDVYEEEGFEVREYD